MNYTEFRVSLRPGADGGITSEASGAYGERRADFKFSWSSEDVQRLVESIEEQIASADSEEELDTELSEQVRRLGQDLYLAVFNGDVRRALDKAAANLEGRDNSTQDSDRQGLRIRLAFNALEDELSPILALQWELLWDPFCRGYLSLSRYTPIIRYLNTPQFRVPLKVSPPIRILIVHASPSNLPTLEDEDERVKIQDALGRVRSVELDFLANPSLGQLRRRLLECQIHVLHFIGHGGFDPSSGEGALAFTGADGRELPVSGSELAEQLADCRPHLRLVFLNSCSGAALPRRRGQDAYTGVASALVKAGVAAVVAMQFTVSDRAAVAFSSAFYQALGHGDPLDAALVEGRLAIRAQAPSSLEWITPALFMSSPDSQIIQVERDDAAEVPLQPPVSLSTGPSTAPAAPSNPKPEVLLAVRSLGDYGVEEDPKDSRLLDLRACFDGRLIRESEGWEKDVFPRLKEFLDAKVRPDCLHRLLLATHLSVAFAIGYCLEAKRGLEFSVVQRGQGGTQEWRKGRERETDGRSDAPDACWRFRDLRAAAESEAGRRIGFTPPSTGAPGAADVAVAVSVSRDVLPDVSLYLEKARRSVGRILEASVMPAPGQLAVRGWDHSVQLAQQLEARIRARSLQEREGVLHIFAAVPHTLMFHLGQLSRGFGRVQLYEYEFEANRPGGYQPSLRLPV